MIHAADLDAKLRSDFFGELLRRNHEESEAARTRTRIDAEVDSKRLFEREHVAVREKILVVVVLADRREVKALRTPGEEKVTEGDFGRRRRDAFYKGLLLRPLRKIPLVGIDVGFGDIEGCAAVLNCARDRRFVKFDEIPVGVAQS